MATKINNTKTDTLNAVKNTVKEVNGFVLETTDELIERTVERTADWQNLAHKAIKGGFKLADNQQELIFTALESVKSQIKQGASRFKTIYSKN